MPETSNHELFEHMNNKIHLALKSEKPIIQSLLQPYLSELSRFPDEHPDSQDANGVYLYPYLDAYWREAGIRFPYLLYSGDKVTGFALVRKDGNHWEMGEFYVKPSFRHLGIAETCAGEIFRLHPGEWRIGFNKHNNASRSLWLKLAKKLARGAISEGEMDDSHDYVSFSV